MPEPDIGSNSRQIPEAFSLHEEYNRMRGVLNLALFVVRDDELV